MQSRGPASVRRELGVGDIFNRHLSLLPNFVPRVSLFCLLRSLSSTTKEAEKRQSGNEFVFFTTNSVSLVFRTRGVQLG